MTKVAARTETIQLTYLKRRRRLHENLGNSSNRFAVIAESLRFSVPHC